MRIAYSASPAMDEIVRWVTAGANEATVKAALAEAGPKPIELAFPELGEDEYFRRFDECILLAGKAGKWYDEAKERGSQEEMVAALGVMRQALLVDLAELMSKRPEVARRRTAWHRLPGSGIEF